MQEVVEKGLEREKLRKKHARQVILARMITI